MNFKDSGIFLNFFFALSVACAVFPRVAVPAVAPIHQVQIETEAQSALRPSWKKTWDKARQLARVNELESSKDAYRNLLKEKPNIVEARWEYCKLLLLLEQWNEASQALEGLLELEPDNLEYLITAGTTALENKHFSKAVEFFGQVYEADPGGPLSTATIKGLIEGFKGLGNKQSAFLLLEQLYQRQENNASLLIDLAGISTKLGLLDKARFYYDRLVEHFPDNSEYIYKAAQVYDYPGLSAKAAPYWRKYIEIKPGYLPFHKNLADYHLKAEQPDQALPHLIKIYSRDSKAKDLALQIADIYSKKLRRPDKALLYYEHYSNSFPQDRSVRLNIRDIRRELARQYLPIVENDAGRQLWKDLDLVTSKKEEIFLEMADLLHEQEKTGQQIRVLEILHEHDGDNLDLTYRLAGLYRLSGDLDSAYALLYELHKRLYGNKKYLLVKADVEIRRGQEQQGLTTLMDYLKHDGSDLGAIRDAVSLAGSLGLIHSVTTIWDNVPQSYKYSLQYIDLNLIYIEALRKCGMYQFADKVYSQLLKVADNNEALATIYFHRADTLLAKDLVFEAEQIVRQMLARDMSADRAIQKLIDLSLREGRVSQAELWLNFLAKRYGIDDLEDYEETLPEAIHFLKIQLLNSEEEYGDAERLVLSHPGYSTYSAGKEFLGRSDLYLARMYFHREMYKKCLEAVSRLNRLGWAVEEAFVLGDIISQRVAENENSALNGATSFTALLERSEIYHAYALDNEALKNVENALLIIPDSLSAKILKVKVLSSLSRHSEALEIVNTIAAGYPEQEYFAKLKLQLEFKSGNFEEVVEKVEIKEEVEEKRLETAAIPEDQSSENMYFWKKLLLARSLWAQNKREQAIEVYDSLLAVPVDTIFLEKMEVEKINFHLPPLKKPFWKVMSFSDSEEPEKLSTVMEPGFFAQNIGKPVDDIAASLYGKYRWQQLIQKELSARQAVEQRQYHQAEKEYLELLEEEKSQESLFDLAYIYNKLGLYGKAAELYEQMKERGPLYPGLDEYIESNMLKRQPRISTTFYTDSRKGRDGYINLERNSFGVEGWLMPSYDQEISASLFHNIYSARNNTYKPESDRFIGTYSTYFENTVDLNISFGLDMPSGSGANEVLYKFELIRRLNKSLEMYGRFEQDLVEDSIRSVTDSIISRDLETGLKYDVFPRWFLGADYRYRMYSDNNEQSRYKLWSMYHLFGEMNQFKIKYSYENIRNTDENVGRDNNFGAEFRIDDRVYWSPEYYWQHLFTLHFKHYFDVNSRPEDPLSYCSFDYSYGYEMDNRQIHEFDLNIFLELNRHYLLKGNFTRQNGDEYEETRAALSLIYRW
ncbi:tetratricopeptide repeat protein [Desulfopila inferna]|uniref:tetratricopeptide repeat protein n=1 Tax=Desulfopila inferna TaxID=468528 RepID=UPI0019669547|nr:tetratricopeptide repeat protein [Desulfopila inferna]